jgi:hypothetical protein
MTENIICAGPFPETSFFNPFAATLVVGFSAFLIRKNRIGVGDFLKFLFGFL